jgi:hypothetical protein
MRRLVSSTIVFTFTVLLSTIAHAQTDATAASAPRWEVTLDGRVGFPSGYVRVGESEIHGTRLRLSDIGITVSEGVEVGAAVWLTPRDAVRAGYVYYFLRGGASLDRAVVFDGREWDAGHVDSNADFWRASLAYERLLTSESDPRRLVASAGLTYIWLNPGLTQHGRTKAEDFYLQELPVPIVGLRFETPLTERLGLRASVDGGLLPKVNSLRQEGGTVYLWQSHADADVAVSYAVTPVLSVEAGYRFTYVHQHEKSHEDDNVFELIDHGPHARLTLRFW